MATEFEYAWVIEAADNDLPGPRYYNLNQDLPNFWTLDHNEAIRFARKVDAEQLWAYLGDEVQPVRFVEHGWG